MKQFRSLTAKTDVIKTGLNSISDDSYFIRLKNNPNHFLHFKNDLISSKEYEVQEAVIGACICDKQHGEHFIKSVKNVNLELVKVHVVLGNDGSLN